ncbi:MAG: hypothetical protein GC155_00015 [Alphaproteobacteria bacterium]|nr:hypothetical protein [Alphaproteobacteria bacterium]
MHAFFQEQTDAVGMAALAIFDILFQQRPACVAIVQRQRVLHVAESDPCRACAPGGQAIEAGNSARVVGRDLFQPAFGFAPQAFE